MELPGSASRQMEKCLFDKDVVQLPLALVQDVRVCVCVCVATSLRAQAVRGMRLVSHRMRQALHLRNCCSFFLIGHEICGPSTESTGKIAEEGTRKLNFVSRDTTTRQQ